ncbi:hypothetical protein ACT3R7_11900 [Halomonas sp. AOP43-A1-21]
MTCPWLPSPIEIEGLTGVPWTPKTAEGQIRYRVEAVAAGSGMLKGVPIVMYSDLQQPTHINAMTLQQFRHVMKPIHND